jgi:hypothetical protein
LRRHSSQFGRVVLRRGHRTIVNGGRVTPLTPVAWHCNFIVDTGVMTWTATVTAAELKNCESDAVLPLPETLR